MHITELTKDDCIEIRNQEEYDLLKRNILTLNTDLCPNITTHTNNNEYPKYLTNGWFHFGEPKGWEKVIQASDILEFDSKPSEIDTPSYYNNDNGSLYKFQIDHDLNSYEFDIIKRVVRCRKKGFFLGDLQKTKNLIDLYIKEQGNNH